MAKQKRVLVAGRVNAPTVQYSGDTSPPTTTSTESSHSARPRNGAANQVPQPLEVNAPPTTFAPFTQSAHPQQPSFTLPIFNYNPASAVSSLNSTVSTGPDEHTVPGSSTWGITGTQWNTGNNDLTLQNHDPVVSLYDAIATQSGSAIHDGYLHQQNTPTSLLVPTTSRFVNLRDVERAPAQSGLPLGFAGDEPLSLPGTAALLEARDDMSCGDGEILVQEHDKSVAPALVASPSPSRTKGRGNGKGKRARTTKDQINEHQYRQDVVNNRRALFAHLPDPPKSIHDGLHKLLRMFEGQKEENVGLREENSRLKEENSRLKEENLRLKEENLELKKNKHGTIDQVLGKVGELELEGGRLSASRANMQPPYYNPMLEYSKT